MSYIVCYYSYNSNTSGYNQKILQEGVGLMEEIMRFGVSMEKNLLTSFDELISRKGVNVKYISQAQPFSYWT